MINTNLGRYDVVKSAFAQHILTGLETIASVTPALEVYQSRIPAHKLAICPDRMVDKAEELLAQYQKSGQTNLAAPLPMVLMAFAKDLNPIAPERGQSIANPVTVALKDEDVTQYYKARFDHVEARVQLAYIAHESETARAMTSQMRLYLNTFEAHRWPLHWQFKDQSFTSTCSLESYEPMDEVVEIDGRTNITLLVWNLTLNFQLPYLTDKVPVVQQVNTELSDATQPISHNSTDNSVIGRWLPFK